MPGNLQLSIIHQEKDFLVVDKAAGVITHHGAGISAGTLEDALKDLVEPGLERSGIVHRLDKDTSGLMVIARNKDTLRKLRSAFKAREVTKEYLALIRGDIREPAGEIEASLGRNPRRGLRQEVTKEGRPALTRFFTEKKFKSYTLLRLIPVTGRTHQLRVHLASLSHPIVGDPWYGGEKKGRLFLHAERLQFRLGGREWKFSSSLPKELVEVLDEIGKE